MLTELARLRSVVDSSPLGMLIQLGTEVVDKARAFTALLDGPPLPAGSQDDGPLRDALDDLCDSRDAFEERYRHAESRIDLKWPDQDEVEARRSQFTAEKLRRDEGRGES